MIERLDNINTEAKVLMQVSGGKDSTACLLLLKAVGIHVEAVHFIHAYSYKTPSEMVRRVTSELDVPLHLIDIGKELEDALVNKISDRPCRYCKAIMDFKTVELAVRKGFDLICVGDTKDDSMLVNRIKENQDGNLFYSRYFNREVTLPENIRIYRPLINSRGEEILEYVKARLPYFIRVNDTGDKYFEYSREGCPLQFKDIGVVYSRQLMEDLYRGNTLCSSFATQKSIRASVHLPSGSIVTIPQGYENECRSYLLSNGFRLPEFSMNETHDTYHVEISLPEPLISCEAIRHILPRFIERLGFSSRDLVLNEGSAIIRKKEYSIVCTVFPVFKCITMTLLSSAPIAEASIQNICTELFHTRAFHIFHQKS